MELGIISILNAFHWVCVSLIFNPSTGFVIFFFKKFNNQFIYTAANVTSGSQLNSVTESSAILNFQIKLRPNLMNNIVSEIMVGRIDC